MSYTLQVSGPFEVPIAKYEKGVKRIGKDQESEFWRSPELRCLREKKGCYVNLKK